MPQVCAERVDLRLVGPAALSMELDHDCGERRCVGQTTKPQNSLNFGEQKFAIAVEQRRLSIARWKGDRRVERRRWPASSAAVGAALYLSQELEGLSY